jgi:hypothetical protein
VEALSAKKSLSPRLREPGLLRLKDASMTHSTVLPLTLATVILGQLHQTAHLAATPCQQLHQHVLQRLALFFAQPLTPLATCDLEHDLQQLLDECGRLILEAVLNHLEPTEAGDAPKHTQRDGQDYCRKNHKSISRGGIATLFGVVQLQRCLYEPLQEARDQGETALAPLEVNLGIVAGNATPALAERVGFLASQHTQQQVLAILQREYHVVWGVKVLRQVTAAVSVGIAAYWLAALQRQLLAWLAQAENSHGRHRIVLSVGRDGIMLPLRGAPTYKEGAVATLTVYDRRDRRVGTVYLGAMPEPYQATLSATLTDVIQEVLRGWTGPLPRLVYVTDAGYHPTVYFEEVLQAMEHPCHPKQRLAWIWVVDYYHASAYVSRLAELLFVEATPRWAWVRRMRWLLLHDRQGVFRVLHSAAYYHTGRVWAAKEEKAYQDAYGYLLKHKESMAYAEYRRRGVPIGSGVTEAGCKVVFTQRFKESGMTWGQEGGKVILQLRLAELSGVYAEVFEQYLRNRPVVPMGTRYPSHDKPQEKVA